MCDSVSNKTLLNTMLKRNMGGPIIILVFCVALVSAQEDFTCDKNNKNAVTYFNTALNCPENTICNDRYKLLNRETKPRPCLAPSDICEYSCGKNTSLVTINTINFECGAGQVCNKEKLSCEVCICARDAYTCSANGNVKLTVNGYEFSCGTGSSCNKNYEAPCGMCIEDVNEGANSGEGGGEGGNGEDGDGEGGNSGGGGSEGGNGEEGGGDGGNSGEDGDEGGNGEGGGGEGGNIGGGGSEGGNGEDGDGDGGNNGEGGSEGGNGGGGAGEGGNIVVV